MCVDIVVEEVGEGKKVILIRQLGISIFRSSMVKVSL